MKPGNLVGWGCGSGSDRGELAECGEWLADAVMQTAIKDDGPNSSLKHSVSKRQERQGPEQNCKQKSDFPTLDTSFTKNSGCTRKQGGTHRNGVNREHRV